MLLQATWIMISIAIPFVIARVFARIKQLGRLGWDDYLMILSLVSTFKECISTLTD